jgi:hypothetical protein
MDAYLCLWDAKGVRCDFLLGHEYQNNSLFELYRGSISKVMVDEYNIGISASYDTTMMIWFLIIKHRLINRDLDSKNTATRLSGVHKEPVLDFDWHNSLVVSGDKNGYVALWVMNY